VQNIEDTLPVRPAHISADAIVNYVIHKVSPNDTLVGISLRYDVRKDLIQRANEFTGDEIYMKKELIIPYASKYFKYC
jgi:LysM repeat protein